MGNAFGRSVRPVRGGKCVVDIDIAEGCHLACELGIVLFLAQIKTGVLRDFNGPGKHGFDGSFRLWTAAILNKTHGATGQSMQRGNQLSGRHSGRI